MSDGKNERNRSGRDSDRKKERLSEGKNERKRFGRNRDRRKDRQIEIQYTHEVMESRHKDSMRTKTNDEKTTPQGVKVSQTGSDSNKAQPSRIRADINHCWTSGGKSRTGNLNKTTG